MLVRLTRNEAKSLGLLVCKNCGWPENNHFSFKPRTCVHDNNCPGYKESIRVGKIIKEK